jgi:hypothetical protein
MYSISGSGVLIEWFFYFHHHHGGALGGEGDVHYDFECCDDGRGSGDVAGVVKSVTDQCESDTFIFFLVNFVIANFFAVSDLSVRQDVSEFDKETYICAGGVTNALEEASIFVARTPFTKWMETGILHECHVFHFVPRCGVVNGVGLVLLIPVVVSEGDDHVGCVNSA